MERHAPSGQFYNWYDHRTGAKLTTWPPTGAPLDADPLLGRQRLAGGRPARRGRPRARSCGRARRRCSTRWTSASTTGPRSTGSCSTTCPTPATAACCYDTAVSESRIAGYIGIEKGEIPQREYYGALAVLPGVLRLVVGRDAARRLHAQLPRRERLRGRLPLQRHARDAVMGREHVRGADAVAVRARGALGAGQLGREPPADRARPDPPRAGRGGLRLLGLLARPTSRRAATRRTASTRSA